MRTVFGKLRAKPRRRRAMVVEPMLAFVAVVALGWVAIDKGYVPVPALERSPATATPGETISARFALCTGAGGTCVIDGDTIRIAGQSVRVADIDTPEVRDYACQEEKALGDRATRRMLDLVNGGAFTLAPWGNRDADQYGRKLRVLSRDGQSLGMVLVAEGLARPWDGARRSWCG
ncbi:thermonuclease family protein [Pelagibacterium mangrovi]|uniref:thermonuclease family protein n=1 Tax=Pelagibacterium mangrovi TaxID=3119828 RepID=UPI002FC6A822